MPRIQDIGVFNAVREAGLAKLVPAVPRVAVGMGTCGRGNGAEGLYQAFVQAIERGGDDLVLEPVGCFGACFQEPLVTVRLPGKPLVLLRRVQANDAGRLLHDLAKAISLQTSSTARSRNGITSPGTSAMGRAIQKFNPGVTLHFSRARRRSCCAIAGSLILTTLKNTLRSADIRRCTKC